MTKSTGPAPDEVLVVAAILGDLDAFEELVRRYRAAVVRTAQSITGRDHAEDVAQEALLLAFKALPSIEDPGKFPAWLGVITRHHAIRWAKRESARTGGWVEFDEVLIEHIGALNQPLVTDSNDAGLMGALESLPADYRTVLRLRFLDEMPLKRIAAFLGLSLSTIKWRLHNGKRLLRKQIESQNHELRGTHGKRQGNTKTGQRSKTNLENGDAVDMDGRGPGRGGFLCGAVQPGARPIERNRP